jgi:hypothetical protein
MSQGIICLKNGLFIFFIYLFFIIIIIIIIIFWSFLAKWADFYENYVKL